MPTAIRRILWARLSTGAKHTPLLAPPGFIPGLKDEALIGRICDGVALPVNVMVMDGVPSIDRLTRLGVSRISHGPIPYIRAMDALKQEARKVHS